MKVVIWVFTGHLENLSLYLNRQDIGDKKIKWLKYPDSVGTIGKGLLYVQVNLDYGDYKKLESKHPYQDLETETELRKPKNTVNHGNGPNY